MKTAESFKGVECVDRLSHEDECEDKYEFVNALIDALIHNGAGRYDRLLDGRPYIERRENGSCVLRHGNLACDVTADSLTSIGRMVLEWVA